MSACAIGEQVIVGDQAKDYQGKSTETANHSKSDCDREPASAISWQCRILDGKSYRISVQENKESLKAHASKQSSKMEAAEQTYKYADTLIKDFLQIDDSFFAVQIFANSNIDAGVAFINSRRLGRARLLQTRVNGRDWYVALLGVYPNLELAHKRAKAYQEIHQGVAPWVRSVKTLKLVYKATII